MKILGISAYYHDAAAALLVRMAATAQRRVLAHYTERKVVAVLDRAWQLAMSGQRTVLEARRQPLA